jgi:hypothetical protein
VPILRDCVIYYGDADLTATANEFSVDASAADLDVTTFGSAGERERIAGIEDATASVMTFGDPAIVEPEFSTRTGTVELLTVVQFPTGGVATAGDRVYALRGLLTATKQPLKVGDVSKLDATMTTSQPEGLLAGTLVTPKTTYSASGSTTSVTLGAQTAPKIAYFGVHIFSVTGDRTLTIRLQSCTASLFSSGTVTTRVTLPTVSTIGSQFGSSTTATTDPYWRANYILGGTTGSVSFAAFAAIQ